VQWFDEQVVPGPAHEAAFDQREQQVERAAERAGGKDRARRRPAAGER
jgi:hypothetical protein